MPILMDYHQFRFGQHLRLTIALLYTTVFDGHCPNELFFTVNNFSLKKSLDFRVIMQQVDEKKNSFQFFFHFFSLAILIRSKLNDI